jgi:transposase InsO family protein
MAKGFLYLVVIMDWVSRAVLAWRLSNTLGAEFCVEALEEALVQYGRPEIFNTDQGSQFTSDDFTGTLKRHGVMISMISMDGKGRCMDNIFVERLWRSLKYEEVYLNAYATVVEAKTGIGAWLSFYNEERQHQSLPQGGAAGVPGRRVGGGANSLRYSLSLPRGRLRSHPTSAVARRRAGGGGRSLTQLPPPALARQDRVRPEDHCSATFLEIRFTRRPTKR